MGRVVALPEPDMVLSVVAGAAAAGAGAAFRGGGAPTANARGAHRRALRALLAGARGSVGACGGGWRALRHSGAHNGDGSQAREQCLECVRCSHVETPWCVVNLEIASNIASCTQASCLRLAPRQL